MAEHGDTDSISVDIPVCYSTPLNVDRNMARQMIKPADSGRLHDEASPPTVTISDGSTIRLVPGPGSLVPNERALWVGREGMKNPLDAFVQGRAKWIGNLAFHSRDSVREMISGIKGVSKMTHP